MSKTIATSNNSKAMAGKQVITISTDGSISGLDHKRKGLDLREFGRAKTQRATLIEWQEHFQKWFIVWTDEMNIADKVWDSALFLDCEVQWESYNGQSMPYLYDVILFADYEDAVAAEVAVIQSMQLAGKAGVLFG